MLMLERRRQGPSREAVEQAALGLLARHGAQVLATARRYAATPEDAEDAYQRSLEILLTKAPTTREEELAAAGCRRSSSTRRSRCAASATA